MTRKPPCPPFWGPTALVMRNKGPSSLAAPKTFVSNAQRRFDSPISLLTPTSIAAAFVFDASPGGPAGRCSGLRRERHRPFLGFRAAQHSLGPPPRESRARVRDPRKTLQPVARSSACPAWRGAQSEKRSGLATPLASATVPLDVASRALPKDACLGVTWCVWRPLERPLSGPRACTSKTDEESEEPPSPSCRFRILLPSAGDRPCARSSLTPNAFRNRTQHNRNKRFVHEDQPTLQFAILQHFFLPFFWRVLAKTRRFTGGSR